MWRASTRAGSCHGEQQAHGYVLFPIVIRRDSGGWQHYGGVGENSACLKADALIRGGFTWQVHTGLMQQMVEHSA